MKGDKNTVAREELKKCKEGRSLFRGQEPVRLIYANPSFLGLTRKPAIYNAHVLESAVLKNHRLPCQAQKCVFCKFAQHLLSPSLCSGEFKEGDAGQCCCGYWLKRTLLKAEACSGIYTSRREIT